MTDVIKRGLCSLDEAIRIEELNDRMYLRHYTYLLKKRQILRTALKRLEKIERRENAET